ncbi:hypothetical protein RchiOBHm_Chr1g0315171 [Rosa chinensis]|uniref:WAT1-related protein n=1 Tax=Rosa chinensis TaxID=74649 RepID=A0A2P6S7A4_ROSCH|nr:hypothetical protein RchiOBHm_Chr1g0315171 [Rosa chinensis]
MKVYMRLSPLRKTALMGVFCSAFQVGVSTWCLNMTGPIFVSLFKPLGIVVAVATGFGV